MSSSSSLAGPPPPPSWPNLTGKPCVRCELSVTDPERKGEGISQYICYKVNSLIEYPEGSGEPATQSCVIRRYSDFVWLHESLEEDLKGLLIPALPDKGLMGRFAPEFVEERRRALQLFLSRIMEHPILRQHMSTLIFLTGTDSALAAARAKLDTGVKKTATRTFLSFFNQATQLVSSAIAPKEFPKTEDDLACEKIAEYSVALQGELSALEAQVDSWLSKEKVVLGRAWFELGVSAAMVSQAEAAGRPTADLTKPDASVDYVPPAHPAAAASSGPSSAYTSFSQSSLGLGGDPELSRLLSLLGSSSDQLAMLLQKKESEEQLEFQEPLKDAHRTAAAVESMLKRRATALQEYHSLLDQCEAARGKLAAAQAAGKEGKLAALEAAVANADSVAEQKRSELASMTASVRSEFARSQAEKNAALAQIVRTFIRLQLEHSAKVSSVWQNVLQQVQQAQ